MGVIKTQFGQMHILMRMDGNMKAFKIRIFTFMSLLALLMSTPFVSSMGLSEPTAGLRLLRGDSADFTFSISAVTDQNDIECTYSITGLDPLVLTFEEDMTLTITKGTFKRIYGSVSVPENAEIKRYTGELVVSCKPLVKVEDITGSVINRIMNADFSVNVVEKEEEKIVPNLPPKEVSAPAYNITMIGLIIIIIVLVIVGYVWSERRKK